MVEESKKEKMMKYDFLTCLFMPQQLNKSEQKSPKIHRE